MPFIDKRTMTDEHGHGGEKRESRALFGTFKLEMSLIQVEMIGSWRVVKAGHGLRTSRE